MQSRQSRGRQDAEYISRAERDSRRYWGDWRHTGYNAPRYDQHEMLRIAALLVWIVPIVVFAIMEVIYQLRQLF